MLARTDSLTTITESWLARFEKALAMPRRARLKPLFHADSHWRDVLALTWQIKTVDGPDAILHELPTHAARVRPTGFKLDPRRTAPRNVRRAGTDTIEAIFSFETAQGRGTGVLRLTPDGNDRNAFKAWTLLTALAELKGHEERLGRSRPQGKVYSRDFRGPNWLDLRNAAAEYAGRDPTALVVGGVPLLQRRSPTVLNVEPSAQLQYALYDEGPSLDDCDLITISMPLSLIRKSHIALTETARKIDKKLLDGLRRRGFKLDFGEDGTGWQFKYLTRGGG